MPTDQTQLETVSKAGSMHTEYQSIDSKTGGGSHTISIFESAGHIDAVIEAKYAQPSSNMVVQPGVELIDKKRNIKGD